MPNPIVQELTCSTSEEFLAALDPRAAHFGKSPRRGAWIFRGHTDARWRLIPSLLRAPTKLLLRQQQSLRRKWESHDPHQVSHAFLCAAELDALRAFFEKADEVGLPPPDDT